MTAVDASETGAPTDLAQVRTIADAVLYEGYLLYPYRASSHKNQSRWQFGVLGPPGAAPGSFGEEPGMAMQCLLTAPGAAPEATSEAAPGAAPEAAPATVAVRLRFLRLQVREVQRRDGDGSHHPVAELSVDGTSVLSWDEAVEHEIALPVSPLTRPTDELHTVAGGEDIETLTDARGERVGRIVRRREELTLRIRTTAEVDGGLVRLSVAVDNEHPGTAADKHAAIRASLIGAHLIVQARGARFVSLLDPPAEAASAAAGCRQRRCWPVLAGPAGATDTVLGAPIILYDHPEVAEQSPGALFDSTEIDEILTLRIMTMTEQEKAEARATDPRAGEIIDRCDAMSAADLRQLHGLLRDPHAPRTVSGHGPDVRDAEPADFDTGGLPWWDPAADAAVHPAGDTVVIDGVAVGKGSLVRVHPSRRADAQDIFFAGRTARVTAVLSDVDGGTHVALVLVDDPAADLHDWYGRYFYFAPDELEPLPADSATHHREESPS